MGLYVTVEMHQGLVYSVNVFFSRQGAKEEEGRWIAQHNIDTSEDRDAIAKNGTEFHVFETKPRP